MLENIRNYVSERMEEEGTTLTVDEIVNHAYMLTQYARYGEVGLSDLDEYLVNEVMDDPTVSDVNNYLSANCYDDYFRENTPEELNDMLYGMSPDEIVRITFFGEYSYSDEYVSFNGYGNLKSCSEDEIIGLYGTETKKYLLETGNVDIVIEEIVDSSEIICDVCNYMIKHGY